MFLIRHSHRSGFLRQTLSPEHLNLGLFCRSKGTGLPGNSSGVEHLAASVKVAGEAPNSDFTVPSLNSVGVIGAGTMGVGIAMCFLNKGINVTLCESNKNNLDRGIDSIASLYRRSSAFRKGNLTEEQVQRRINLISGSLDPNYSDLKECDVVIEAAFENMDLKKDIFNKLGQVCKASSILCTNTSYLNIDEIADASEHPERVMGAHFFSPANVMPLLENVKGKKTSEKTIATAMRMGEVLGKVTVLAGNGFGFIGNRMFEPYTQEAILLLEDGVSPERIDSILGPENYGMAMGPLRVLDLAGNDIGYRIRGEDYYLYKPSMVKGRRGQTWTKLADELYSLGRYGQKTKKGWYKYEGREALEDNEVAEMCEQHRSNFNLKNIGGQISNEEILERCIYPMINEGFRILEEGIAQRPSDIDVVWAYGYGFPKERGGPMYYADTVGLENVLNTLLKYGEKYPELPKWHFEPAKLLKDLVSSKTTLIAHYKQR